MKKTLLDRLGANMRESIGPPADQVLSDPAPALPAAPPGRLRNRDLGDVALDQVIADPDQPRKTFDEEALARLTESIRARGVKQPISVRKHPSGKWMVLCGERRYRAATAAGLKTIPARFIEGDLTADEITEEQLVENLHREDLNPMDEARAFDAYARRNSWSGKELAEQLFLTPSKVSRALALLDLPAEVQELVASGQLSARHAYELGKLESRQEQIDMAGKVVSEGLTKDATAKAVKERKLPQGNYENGGSPPTLPMVRPPAWSTTYTLTGGAKITVALALATAGTADVLDALRELLAILETQAAERAA